MITKTKGKTALMEFGGYFASHQKGRTGFLPYQSSFILKLIPLGHNADTASALKQINFAPVYQATNILLG